MGHELATRVNKAAKILISEITNTKAQPATIDRSIDIIWEALRKFGIDNTEEGLKILSARTSIYEDFEKSIAPIVNIRAARIKIVWEFLKGRNPFRTLKNKGR